MASVGVVVGRFQTHCLNETHIGLINQVWAKHNKVMILLGCKPGATDAVNPLSYGLRQKMFESALPNVVVQALPDCATDEQWSNELDRVVRSVFPTESITLYGEQDTFIKKYTGKFITVELAPKEVVNETVDREIHSEEFRAGVIYGIGNRYPIMYPTVDVAVIDYSHNKVLMARKADETKLRFVGGFVNTDDPHYEYAALRELNEETGIMMAGGFEDKSAITYIGSYAINDWRYPNVDKIMTTFFVCDIKSNCGGVVSPNDDIAELTWEYMDYTLLDKMMECHRPLAVALLNKKNYQSYSDKIVEKPDA